MNNVRVSEDLESIREVLRALPGEIHYVQIQAKEIIFLSDPHLRKIDVTIRPPVDERFAKFDALVLVQSAAAYFGTWHWLDHQVYGNLEKGVVIFKQGDALQVSSGTFTSQLA